MTPFAAEVARGRAAQAAWAAAPVRTRLRPVGEFRHLIAERAAALTAAVLADVGRDPDEVVATDLLPTAAAAKWLQRNAARVLAPTRVGGRPLWLGRGTETVFRRPRGVVALIGTWNYPVFLTAVPLLHALTAGNAVLWKPSEHTPATAAVLPELVRAAGFPPGLVEQLPADRETGPLVAEADVDFVHFTGSERTGRALAARLGDRLIPSALELSGVDAVIVRADADVELAARSAWYGATLNGGQTCMATRRAFVAPGLLPDFLRILRPLIAATPPARLVTSAQAEQVRRLIDAARAAGCEVIPANGDGGVVVGPPADLGAFHEAAFAPLLAVAPAADDDTAVALHNANRFGLTAAIFTRDPAAATVLAGRLRAGCVVVNDVIVPTAHPGTPFGGVGASGWGVTQGADGLLQLTVPQAVSVRAGRFRPHVDAALGGRPAAEVVRGLLAATHGRTLRDRWRGVVRIVRGVT